MKILLNTCVIIFASYLFGKHLLPSLFGNFFVFWGVNISLAILLAIGFSKALSIYFQQECKTIKSFSNSAWFLLLFLTIIIIPISVHHSMDSLNTFKTSSLHALPVHDSSAFDTEERRKLYAKFVFGEYGIKIPYKLESGEYITFEPTEDQIEKFNIRQEQKEETIEIEQNLSRVAYSSFRLAIIQVVLFFVVFVSTTIYSQYQENKDKR